MAEKADKVTFRISAAAAPYLGQDKPRELKLQAAAGKVALPTAELVRLVFYLCHDGDPEVKRTAVATLRALPSAIVAQQLSDPQLHPRLLDALAQLHGSKPELVPLFAGHPMLSEKAASFLARASQPPAPPHPGESAHPPGGTKAEPPAPEAGDEEEPEEEGPVDEASEEFQSKYQMAQAMGVGEKIKMAMTGDKEWRTILIRDANKLVSSAVIKNPRLTENEVLGIAKSSVQNEEIMRIICANKEWVKNPQIRKALVVNNKTPVATALRFVATLSEKELAQLAKSKNVSSVVSAQARRILFSKREGK